MERVKCVCYSHKWRTVVGSGFKFRMLHEKSTSIWGFAISSSFSIYFLLWKPTQLLAAFFDKPTVESDLGIQLKALHYVVFPFIWHTRFDNLGCFLNFSNGFVVPPNDRNSSLKLCFVRYPICFPRILKWRWIHASFKINAPVIREWDIVRYPPFFLCRGMTSWSPWSPVWPHLKTCVYYPSSGSAVLFLAGILIASILPCWF